MFITDESFYLILQVTDSCCGSVFGLVVKRRNAHCCLDCLLVCGNFVFGPAAVARMFDLLFGSLRRMVVVKSLLVQSQMFLGRDVERERERESIHIHTELD